MEMVDTINDIIQLSHSVFAHLSDVFAHAAQIGTDTIIAADPSHSITLNNTTLADLHAHNFHLV
jgi:hypothetical protein